MNRINLIIVDDHQLFRDGLAGLLCKHKDFETLASLPDGESLFEHLSKGILPDIILLDLTMPGINGIEVLEKLRKYRGKGKNDYCFHA